MICFKGSPVHSKHLDKNVRLVVCYCVLTVNIPQDLKRHKQLQEPQISRRYSDVFIYSASS